MSTLDILRGERDLLLARTNRVLQDDARVTAAWLSGSYGRGETDGWSDLDLHVAVTDSHFESFITEHQTLFSRCGPMIHVISHGIPSWSMPNGRFWLVQYAPYMLEIDWNIGPTEATTIPEASRILFNRGNLPITPSPQHPPDEVRRNEARQQLDFFWSMAPIAIKFAGRGHTRRAVQQVELLSQSFVMLWRILYQPELLQKDKYHQNRPLAPAILAKTPLIFGPVIDPAGALNVILSHCREVELLHAKLAELGVSVDERVVHEVYALAEIARASAQEGGSNPYAGSRR